MQLWSAHALANQLHTHHIEVESQFQGRAHVQMEVPAHLKVSVQQNIAHSCIRP